jgi:arsenate reductase
MKKILFLCVANSARSQLAEGLARFHWAGLAQVYSAGSKPTKVNPLAIQALKEWDLDISHHSSKTVDDLSHMDFDYVITLCAEEVCPVALNARQKLHWGFPDPADPIPTSDTLLKFRKVREGILEKILEFKETDLKEKL